MPTKQKPVVADFNEFFYQRFADRFVDKYEQESPEAAGAWAAIELTTEQIKQARPYVTQEFLLRGYEFEEQT